MGSMYMSNEILNETLMSTAYRKYWPVSDSTPCEMGRNNVPRQRSSSCGTAPTSHRPDSTDARKVDFADTEVVVVEARGVTHNDKGAKDDRNLENGLRTDIVLEMTTKLTAESIRKMSLQENGQNGFAKLDMKTLQNIGWVPSSSNDDKKQKAIAEAEEFCKLTKVEFRRLQEQVKDVSLNLRNRFRTSAYQSPSTETKPGFGEKLYQRPNESPSQVYRSQLASSLKAFQNKHWAPLNYQELESNYIRCKPVQTTYDNRPSTSCSMRAGSASRNNRPKSVPPSSLRAKSASGNRSDTPTSIRPGPFDTLRPQVISDLMGPSERPTSSYDGPADDKSPFVEELVAETKKLLDNDDAFSTSGIDSGASDAESPSSDEDSDFEPDIDQTINIPDLNLRPEKLDHFYIPEPKRGWRQYDFDMTNIDLPPYEFQSPFPEDLEDLDLGQMARLKWNWRNHVKVKKTREPDLEGMLDRLVEFEKLQKDTIDWENKRAAQVKKALPRRNNSAKSLQSLVKDKRCESSCLQATCFGDCPEKLSASVSCEHCRQSYCTGTCKEVKYEQRMRQARQEEERPVTPKSPFPRACTSCQKRHNAKFINANNLVLGTQRYNNATFNRGQGSLKTKDLRPRTPAGLPKDVLKEFEKMNIDPSPPPRPSTSASIARPRSRNAMFPGKSFSSQRKNSLTELDKIGKPPKNKRAKTVIKLKRPKTAG
ncbi:hypothetical protein ACF0H5_006790 [Mactra antiquata]